MYENINLINGNIISLDSHNSDILHSISIENGKIINFNEPISNARTIDLKGATIIPGFVDCHFHLKNMGKRLQMINLKPCKTLAEVIKKIKEAVMMHSDNRWIFGFGWDQTLWGNDLYPTKDLLNNISSNNPIVLTRIDGHCIWINDRVINQTTYDLSNLVSPSGGEIINKCIFIDNAMIPINNIIPKESDEEVLSWISSATKEITKRGITNVHDAWQDSSIISAVKQLERNNNLPIRCYGMISSYDKKLLNECFNNGHYNSKKYTLRSVKAFIDGALGSRGAALFEPYSDCKNTCGLVLISKKEFHELAVLCNKNNFQLCTHAIGDKGNRIVLDTYINNTKNNSDHRWRVEHAQMVEDSDINKFKRGNIIPSMQPSHCTSDMRWMNKRIGNDRMHRISRWKTFVDANIPIAGGSDCPIEDGEPLFEYFSAVTRQDHNGWPKDGWQPQEKLDRTNALKMFTTWASYSEFAENRRGIIRKGYDADLTILSDDIIQCDISNILDIQALGTIVNGEIEYLNI